MMKVLLLTNACSVQKCICILFFTEITLRIRLISLTCAFGAIQRSGWGWVHTETLAARFRGVTAIQRCGWERNNAGIVQIQIQIRFSDTFYYSTGWNLHESHNTFIMPTTYCTKARSKHGFNINMHVYKYIYTCMWMSPIHKHLTRYKYKPGSSENNNSLQ